MTIYLKITLAMLMSAVLIEIAGWLGVGSYGIFFMAFVYAGVLLAGSFYLVTIAEKYLSPKKMREHKKPRQTASSEKEKQVYHPLFNRNKNHFKVL